MNDPVEEVLVEQAARDAIREVHQERKRCDSHSSLRYQGGVRYCRQFCQDGRLADVKRSKLLYILRVVWEVGPSSNREIAREAGYSPKDCYPILYKLKNDGYITHDERELYDISEDGLRTLTYEKKQQRFEFN